MKPEEINFNINYDVVDPFALYNAFPMPDYLEVSHNDEQVNLFEME